MTDLHFGKATSTFNPDVCAQRLCEMERKIRRIRGLLGDYDFDELVVSMLGDMNDGTGIYPTQFHHQKITDVNEQALVLSDLLARFFRKLQDVWKHVRIEAVPGNHGRAGKFAHESANWDLVCYNYLAKELKPSGIKIGLNSGSDNPFIRKIKVKRHNYVLYHGHDIRTFSNIPWYGMMLRISRWLSTKIAPFDVALLGHFHTVGCWDINRVQLFLSGTMVSDDDWALQSLGWESACKWWIFGVSDHRPVTWQFRLELN